MMVIFYHTADRNLKIQCLKHPFRRMYLPFSAVHQNQVRQFPEAFLCCPFCILLHLLQMRPCQGR